MKGCIILRRYVVGKNNFHLDYQAGIAAFTHQRLARQKCNKIYLLYLLAY